MRNSPQIAKGSGPFGKAVFNWMKDLSDSARGKLEQSQFIKIGKTSQALRNLVKAAKKTDSILAICGYKGSYSTAYYKTNFKKCRAVKRIFSYEAIRNEITSKNEFYALKGLRLHLNKKATTDCDVEVLLIPKKKLIRNLLGDSFDPPFSFGLAILVDQNEFPRMAVVHWEMGAEPLKHLIDIEGVIIDGGQDELLHELVQLHEEIADSNPVLSSKRAQKNAIIAACKELHQLWKSRPKTRKGRP